MEVSELSSQEVLDLIKEKEASLMIYYSETPYMDQKEYVQNALSIGKLLKFPLVMTYNITDPNKGFNDISISTKSVRTPAVALFNCMGNKCVVINGYHRKDILLQSIRHYLLNLSIFNKATFYDKEILKDPDLTNKLSKAESGIITYEEIFNKRSDVVTINYPRPSVASTVTTR